MEEHPRRPFREQNPLRSRESKKSSFVWQDFFVRNMEGGFLTGSESLCGKSQGESPFFLGKKLRSIEHPPHLFSEGIKESCAQESRKVVPNLHVEGALAGTQVGHGQEAPYILFPEMPDKAFWSH